MKIAGLRSIGNSKIPSLEVREKSLDQPTLVESKENKLNDYWVNREIEIFHHVISYNYRKLVWLYMDGHTTIYRPSPHHEPHYHAGIKKVPLS